MRTHKEWSQCQLPPAADIPLALASAALCRFCCKSLFALAIKNSFGRRRDFRVKMWGTSSPDDKLTGDRCNVIEATSIGGRRSDFFTARKLAPGNLGLLQQYLHTASHSTRPVGVCLLGWSGQKCCDAVMRAFDPSATLAVHCGTGFGAGFSPYQSTRLSRYNAAPELGCGYAAT
jgi:hypothetical protein